MPVPGVHSEGHAPGVLAEQRGRLDDDGISMVEKAVEDGGRNGAVVVED